MSAKITLSSDNRLQVETPYSADFVDDLKRKIYYRDREWVPGLKAWMVSKAYLAEVEDLCRAYFKTVDTDLGAPLQANDNYEMLFLSPNAPTWLIKKVYKLLMQYYHPDTGNPEADQEKCKEITAAYSNIKDNLPF